MKKNNTLWIVLVVFIIIIFLFWFPNRNTASALDGFAQCLEEKEATFFGAFWCPNCQDQKRMFGRAEKHLPYVECSTPDGRGQLTECTEEGIEAYPTWEFADGERITGSLPLSLLAEKTGCELPK